ncbi:MAG TPA: helix-turn-helix transcriptional regulator [Alphaproteobacteria bacterium]
MSVPGTFGDERNNRRPVASGTQCRAARGLLNWTQKRLAEEAGVARKTIADFEVGDRRLRYRTRRDITETLERAGVEFLWSGGTGGEGLRLAKGVRPGSPLARTDPDRQPVKAD